jgi:hypothetical protein
MDAAIRVMNQSYSSVKIRMRPSTTTRWFRNNGTSTTNHKRAVFMLLVMLTVLWDHSSAMDEFITTRRILTKDQGSGGGLGISSVGKGKGSKSSKSTSSSVDGKGNAFEHGDGDDDECDCERRGRRRRRLGVGHRPPCECSGKGSGKGSGSSSSSSKDTGGSSSNSQDGGKGSGKGSSNQDSNDDDDDYWSPSHPEPTMPIADAPYAGPTESPPAVTPPSPNDQPPDGPTTPLEPPSPALPSPNEPPSLARPTDVPVAIPPSSVPEPIDPAPAPSQPSPNEQPTSLARPTNVPVAIPPSEREPTDPVPAPAGTPTEGNEAPNAGEEIPPTPEVPRCQVSGNGLFGSDVGLAEEFAFTYQTVVIPSVTVAELNIDMLPRLEQDMGDTILTQTLPQCSDESSTTDESLSRSISHESTQQLTSSNNDQLASARYDTGSYRNSGSTRQRRTLQGDSSELNGFTTRPRDVVNEGGAYK